MQSQLMKLLSFSLVFFCLTCLNAQDNETQLERPKKRTEIGLTYQLGEGISLLFKQQLKEKMFLRSTMSGTFNGQAINSSYNFSVGGSLGLEFHIPLSEKLSLYHGPELTARYSQYGNGDTQITSQSLGVGYFFGLIFKVSDRFSIHGEINHSLSRYHSRTRYTPIRRISNVYSDFNTSLKVGATFNLKNNKKMKHKFRF